MSGGGAGGTGGEGGEGGGGSPMPVDVAYTATVADCLYIGATTGPDPDACAADQMANYMTVDLQESASGLPANAYLAFELDSQVIGKEILSVTLELTAGPLGDAAGPDSGEVVAVESVTRDALFVAVPMQVGGVLGANQGPVSLGETVTWVLPTSLATGVQAVHLGVLHMPTGTNNGVDYWNVNGTHPPRLLITAR